VPLLASDPAEECREMDSSTSFQNKFFFCSPSLVGLVDYLTMFQQQASCWTDVLPVYGSAALVDLGRFLSFLIYTQSAGLLGRGSARRKAATYTQNNTNKK
jgi:hypothetical protein